MLFVAVSKCRAGTMEQIIARRLEYTWPEGATVLAEYWMPTHDPASIVIFEADQIAPIMAAAAAWDDVLDITIMPAVTAEEGMALARAQAGGMAVR